MTSTAAHFHAGLAGVVVSRAAPGRPCIRAVRLGAPPPSSHRKCLYSNGAHQDTAGDGWAPEPLLRSTADRFRPESGLYPRPPRCRRAAGAPPAPEAGVAAGCAAAGSAAPPAQARRKPGREAP